MKYIKKYEIFILNNLKMYVVTNIEELYYIDEILNIDKRTISVRCLYFTNHDNIIKRGKMNKVSINSSYYEDYTIYTSDNLDDCYNFLETTINTNKYNL